MSSTTASSIFPFPAPSDAPASSQPALARLRESVGAIPNLAASMAYSPALIDAFVTSRALFHQHSTFTRAERELISLANALENGCGYCTAIHTAFAAQEGVAEESVVAVRAKSLPKNPRDAALVEMAQKILRNRGRIEEADVNKFVAAGFAKTQTLELVAAAAISTIANYSGRLFRVPLDEFLLPHMLPS